MTEVIGSTTRPASSFPGQRMKHGSLDPAIVDRRLPASETGVVPRKFWAGPLSVKKTTIVSRASPRLVELLEDPADIPVDIRDHPVNPGGDLGGLHRGGHWGWARRRGKAWTSDSGTWNGS